MPPEKKPEEVKPPETTGTQEAAAPAIIVVSLPADAKLTIDDAATRSTSANRRFVSPALERGQEYFYTLKAEIVRDGQTLTTNKRVAVRAGQETAVTLEFPVVTLAGN
jgi:uncharacterized protein (TIGR03000 family)